MLCVGTRKRDVHFSQTTRGPRGIRGDASCRRCFQSRSTAEQLCDNCNKHTMGVPFRAKSILMHALRPTLVSRWKHFKWCFKTRRAKREFKGSKSLANRKSIDSSGSQPLIEHNKSGEAASSPGEAPEDSYPTYWTALWRLEASPEIPAVPQIVVESILSPMRLGTFSLASSVPRRSDFTSSVPKKGKTNKQGLFREPLSCGVGTLAGCNIGTWESFSEFSSSHLVIDRSNKPSPRRPINPPATEEFVSHEPNLPTDVQRCVLQLHGCFFFFFVCNE